MINKFKYMMFVLVLALSVSSCSTTRILTGSQRRLTKNVIKITNDKDFNPTDLTPYLKQNAKGWTPFMCVYNWQNGKNKGWDKFVHKLGTPPVIFDSTLVTSSIINITSHLEYIGYFDSKVRATAISRGNKKIRMLYDVTLGKRYPISNVSYQVRCGKDFADEFYRDTTNSLIRKGEWISEDLLEKESARSASVMRNKGFYDFSKNYFVFQADTVSEKGGCLLDVVISQHTRNETESSDKIQQKYKIGKISINYPQSLRFREKVLSDLNNLKPGMPFSDRSIDVAYSRMSSVSLFNSVNIHLTPTQDRKVDCDINLQKSKIQGFKVGLEASVNTTGLFGVSPELSYFHRNIFHGGEVLTVSVSTNHQLRFDDPSIKSNEVTATASVTIPRFLPFSTRSMIGPNLPKTEIKISYNYQNRPEYIRHRAGASFGYIGNFTRRFSYQFSPISLNVLNIGKMDPKFIASLVGNYYLLNSFLDQFDLGCNATLYYNSAGSTAPKTSYWYARLKFDLSGNQLCVFNRLLKTNETGQHLVFGIPYLQYVRTELQLGRTFVWGEKVGQAFATRLLIGAGTGYGNSNSLPFDKSFYSGGANSLRGWTARTVGPGTAPLDKFWTIPNQFGNFKLEANIEYRFDIFWRFAGAVFVDAGNIWDIGTAIDESVLNRYLRAGNFAKAIAADWGVGLRLDLNFLVLRLDYGMRFHDPALEGNKWIGPAGWFKTGNYAFHFGVGYPF